MKKSILTFLGFALIASAFSKGVNPENQVANYSPSGIGNAQLVNLFNSNKLAEGENSSLRAFYFGINVGYSAALGDYATYLKDYNATSGISTRIDFSGRIYKMLAIRAEYGLFFHSGSKNMNGMTSKSSVGNLYFGIGPEVRFNITVNSQIAAYFTVNGTSYIGASEISGVGNTISSTITNSGSGYGFGSVYRTALTDRLSFLGNIEYRSSKSADVPTAISALNLNVGLGINFGR